MSATARDILDEGAAGLAFFAAFVPAYNICVRAGLAGPGARELDYRQDFAIRLHEPSVSLPRLRAEADRLEASSRTLLDGADRLVAHHSGLTGVWRGGAATTAADSWRVLGASLRTAAARLADVATGLSAAAVRVELACRGKAAAVRELQADEVAGLGPAAVELLACVAAGESTEVRQAAVHLGIPFDERLPGEYWDALRADVASWLTDGFVPLMEARAHAFDSACERARTDCDGAWTELDETLAQASTEPSTADAKKNATPPAGADRMYTTGFGGIGLVGSGERDIEHRTSLPITDTVVDVICVSTVDEMGAEEPPAPEPPTVQDDLAVLDLITED